MEGNGRCIIKVNAFRRTKRRFELRKPAFTMKIRAPFPMVSRADLTNNLRLFENLFAHILFHLDVQLATFLRKTFPTRFFECFRFKIVRGDPKLVKLSGFVKTK